MQRWVRSVALAALIAAGTPALPEERSLVPLVPWKVLQPDEVITAPLALFWVPASPEAMRRSAMLTSDSLTLFASRCVAMRVVRFDDGGRLAALQVEEELPVAVLVDRDGRILGSVQSDGGRLSVREVEDLVRSALDEREAQAEKLLDAARQHAGAGDVPAALELYGKVSEARCLCPRQAKVAAKALRRLERK
jgi:nucleotide-binding universal stress UspA family protein